MSAILAIATACVLIIWGIFRKPRRHRASRPVFVKRYIHPGHTWMQPTEDGDVLVGVDDFAQSLIGTVDAVRLPRLLKRVKQGSVLCYVRHNYRVVPMVSPVTGRIIQKNEMIMHNPVLVNTSPYGDGWLVRIKPGALKPQLNNLLIGKSAQQWLEQAKAHLVRCFSTTPALMYQDGGVMLNNVADHCSDDEWKTLTKEFFLTE